MGIRGRLKQRLRTTTDYQNKNEIILRDFLALERTKMANERTFMTYVRFAIFMIITATAFIRVDELKTLRYFGFVMIGFSVIILIVGFVRFRQLRNQLHDFYYKSAHLIQKEENKS